MAEVGVKDTTAYQITRQVMDHVYGEDESLSSEEFAAVYRLYLARGGTWRGIQDGDMGCVKVLEDSLDAFVNYRRVREQVDG